MPVLRGYRPATGRSAPGPLRGRVSMVGEDQIRRSAARVWKSHRPVKAARPDPRPAAVNSGKSTPPRSRPGTRPHRALGRRTHRLATTNESRPIRRRSVLRALGTAVTGGGAHRMHGGRTSRDESAALDLVGRGRTNDARPVAPGARAGGGRARCARARSGTRSRGAGEDAVSQRRRSHAAPAR
jgi:hypothetical protein